MRKQLATKSPRKINTISTTNGLSNGFVETSENESNSNRISSSSSTEEDTNESESETRPRKLLERKTKSLAIKRNQQLIRVQSNSGNSLNHGLQKEKKRFSCQICVPRRKFNLEATYKKHMDIFHDANKQIFCSFCHLFFEMKHEVKLHERLYHDKRSYQSPNGLQLAITFPLKT